MRVEQNVFCQLGFWTEALQPLLVPAGNGNLVKFKFQIVCIDGQLHDVLGHPPRDRQSEIFTAYKYPPNVLAGRFDQRRKEAGNAFCFAQIMQLVHENGRMDAFEMLVQPERQTLFGFCGLERAVERAGKRKTRARSDRLQYAAERFDEAE